MNTLDLQWPLSRQNATILKHTLTKPTSYGLFEFQVRSIKAALTLLLLHVSAFSTIIAEDTGWTFRVAENLVTILNFAVKPESLPNDRLDDEI